MEGFKMKKYCSMIFSAFLIVSAVSINGALAAGTKEVILATTTSTQDTGLLDVLLPIFKKKTGFIVKTIAVGSGQAMAMGERGEADVMLVHSPAAEKIFIEKGFGVNRRIVMHNDFVILGPAADPAGIKGSKSAPDAFKKIAAAGALFVSRGDNSGTHVKELKIWKDAGIITDKRKWYQQTGLGMGQTLGVVSEKGGYTLCDRSTYLALKRNLALVPLFEGDASLKNIYHIIEVNSAKFPRVNGPGARAFSDFMVTPEIQEIIGSFGTDKFGQPLFFPDAGKKPE
jgi:tungstate transport system substrate-binding protein